MLNSTPNPIHDDSLHDIKDRDKWNWLNAYLTSNMNEGVAVIDGNKQGNEATEWMKRTKTIKKYSWKIYNQV